VADNFNENLSTFLTSCRESALKELTANNAEYKQMRSDVIAVSEKMNNGIPKQYAPLVYELIDSYQILFRMEVNYLYLQGFRDCINLYKRLDGSFGEGGDFEKVFV